MIFVAQSFTAIAPKITSSFSASGGTGPYTYSVRPNGAGGTIDASSGLYTAPDQANSDPVFAYDVVQATDSLGAIGTSKILVGTPLLLFCEIIQREMNLTDGRVYLWDQKIFQPSDDDIYVAVSIPSCKPFSNIIGPDPELGWEKAVQVTNFLARADLDIISRGPAARDRKEEVVMAFNSLYAQAQQEANSFYIGKIPPGGGFVNLSQIDGAAIPYRYRISVNLQYAVTKTKDVGFIDTFEDVSVATNP